MTQLTVHRGISVLDPDPTGSGGLAIQNNFKKLADRLADSHYVQGLELSWSDATTLTVGTGAAISDDGGHAFRLQAASLVSTTTRGPGGLDAGVVAPGTVYLVSLVGGPGVADAVILSASSPSALPPGYVATRRIGFVVTDTQGDLLRFRWCGNGPSRALHYGEPATRTRVLERGDATNFERVDLSAFVPPTACVVTLAAAFTNHAPAGTSTDRVAELRTAGDVSDGSLHRLGTGTGSSFPVHARLELPCSSGRRIEYRVSDAQCELSLSIASVVDLL